MRKDSKRGEKGTPGKATTNKRASQASDEWPVRKALFPHVISFMNSFPRRRWIDFLVFFLLSFVERRKATKNWLKSNFPVWNQFPHFTRNWKWKSGKNSLIRRFFSLGICRSFLCNLAMRKFTYFLVLLISRRFCLSPGRLLLVSRLHRIWLFSFQLNEWKRCKIYDALWFLEFALREKLNLTIFLFTPSLHSKFNVVVVSKCFGIKVYLDKGFFHQLLPWMR